MFEPWIPDWLHLLVRWFHLVVGAAWVGTSFYFNWLNQHIRPVDDPEGRIAGALWSVHGGAFYQVTKMKGAPARLPETLHWFKWEAYLTWVSGIVLLLLVYWIPADVMMVRAESSIPPLGAAAIGASSLVLGWFAYHMICRTKLARSPQLIALVVGLLLAASAFALSMLLSARAAYIHVASMMGTIMAANVFFVIIPGQRAMVDAMIQGREPDLARGRDGAMRSLHNNYFTLPVLFIMISSHFPFTYGHPMGWAVLVVLGAIGVAVRHHFNLKGQGRASHALVPLAALALLGLAAVSHGPRFAPPPGETPSVFEIESIIARRCIACHTLHPTFPGIAATPKNLILDSRDAIKRNAPAIYLQAVATQVMPLGNLTQMTLEEREILGRWINAGAPLE